MLIDAQQISQLIPHSGTMSLLDGVLEWNSMQILCTSQSHLSQDNPLRSEQGLAMVHGVEYGAQAMAVHGALLAQQRGERLGAGYLVAVRELNMRARWLDHYQGPVQVSAQQLLQQGDSLIYQIELRHDEIALLSARATVRAMPSNPNSEAFDG